MKSRISQTWLRVLTALTLVSLAAIAVAAQEPGDPDPNSPTPVLSTIAGSARALAEEPGKINMERIRPQAFQLNTKVVLFATNLILAEGEGANAFRIYGTDRDNHEYRFPVIDIRPLPAVPGTFALTVLLTDEIGYWAPPRTDGDLTLYLTWRGLASNTVRLGIGQIDVTATAERALKQPSTSTEGDAPEYVGYRWSGDRKRFLEQATFGPSPATDFRLRRIGIRSWLAEQFAMQYPSTAFPYPDNQLQPTNQPPNCDGNETVPDLYPTCQRDTYSQYMPQTWFFKEAFYGDAQLKHRVAWALSQIWVTSGNDIQQGRHMVEWHKVLSKHAFGNYRNLMKEMTLNPTMGEYLNMRESTRNSPNENYARELKQLFTVGLFMLNPDGTLQRDGQNNPIPTYTQNTVNDFTKVLTGWRLCNLLGANCPTLGTSQTAPGAVNYIDPMVLNLGVTTINGNLHDLTAKTLLDYPGVNTATRDIPVCGSGCAAPTVAATALANIRTYGDASLEKLLDNTFNHPNVGPFVSKILIQHMVTSDPTPAYVGRVAAVFNANRTNPTQMKEVIRAILLDPEARGDAKTDPNYGKLREPVQLFTNFARTFGVRSATGTGQSDGNFSGGRACGRAEFNNMAQIPFLAPTVFNYYPPDYGVPGTSLIGPEFAILTTGTAIARATFINRLTFVATTAPATTPTAAYAVPFPVNGVDCPSGTSFDFSDLVALSQADTTGNQLVDELNRRMLHSTMPASLRTSILGALPSYGGTTALTHESRVREAIYLVATSSQYQIQR